MVMADSGQGFSVSTARSGPSLGEEQRARRKSRRVGIIALAVLLTAALAAILTAGWLRYHVEPIPRTSNSALPRIRYVIGNLELGSPTGILLGRVGTYSDELTAYLRLDYLKGIESIAGNRIFLVTQEEESGPHYVIYLELPDDILAADRSLAGLMIAGHIKGFELQSPTLVEIQQWEEETKLFNAAYQQPVKEMLLHLPRKALTSAVASFILFKVRTDRRVRERLEPAAGKELSSEDAKNFRGRHDRRSGILRHSSRYAARDWRHGEQLPRYPRRPETRHLEEACPKRRHHSAASAWTSAGEQLFDWSLANHPRNAPVRPQSLPAG